LAFGGDQKPSGHLGGSGGGNGKGREIFQGSTVSQTLTDKKGRLGRRLKKGGEGLAEPGFGSKVCGLLKHTVEKNVVESRRYRGLFY